VDSKKAKNPVTFTIPAIKERIVAMCRLCFRVLLLP